MGGLAALGGGGAPENACAAAATRPKFIGSPSTAVDDDDDLDDGGGGDVVDEAATAALPARCMPAARARDVAGFASARWAAEAKASPSAAVDGDDLDGGGGGDVVDEVAAAAALPARWMPAARARDVAGFASARWAAVMAAAAGIGDCIISAAPPVVSEVVEVVVGPPTRARRSGLDVKYLCACAVRLKW